MKNLRKRLSVGSESSKSEAPPPTPRTLSSFSFFFRHSSHSLTMRPQRIQVSSSRWLRLEEAEELETKEEPLFLREPFMERIDLESASSSLPETELAPPKKPRRRREPPNRRYSPQKRTYSPQKHPEGGDIPPQTPQKRTYSPQNRSKGGTVPPQYPKRGATPPKLSQGKRLSPKPLPDGTQTGDFPQPAADSCPGLVSVTPFAQ